MAQDFPDLLKQVLWKYGSFRLLQGNRAKAVYYGVNQTTQEEVVIKILALGAIFGAGSWKTLERFKREAFLIANLHHHNIVPIIDCVEHEDFICIIMPYYKYGTLEDLIVNNGPASLMSTIRYMTQLAPALDHAHAQGVTHRDIKPSNILLAQNNRLVLSEYQAAYSLLSPDYQKIYLYTQAYADYIKVQYSCFTLDNTTMLANNRVQVDIAVDQIPINSSGPEAVIKEYTLSFLAGKVQGEWRLTPENLQRISTRGTCVEP